MAGKKSHSFGLTLMHCSGICRTETNIRPVLQKGERKSALENGSRAAMKHNHDKLVWHCRLCLLMPDHLHAILAFPREPGMQTSIKNWKKYVAGKQGVDWQRDFFDHRLRNHHELEEKTLYILMNPVRKGLCERPEDWTWVYRPND